MGFNLLDEMLYKDIISVDKHHLQISKFNIHLSLYPARAFAITLNRIAKLKDVNYLEEIGIHVGDTAVKEFLESLSKIKLVVPDKYKTFENTVKICGFGIVSIKKESNKIKLTVQDNPVISSAKNLYSDKSNICHFYSGFYSSFVRVFYHLSNIKFKHTKCVTKGDKLCEWEMEFGIQDKLENIQKKIPSGLKTLKPSRGNFLKRLITQQAIKLDNGKVLLYGKIPYIYGSSNVWATMWQKLGDDLGEKNLFDIGYEAGSDGADEMIQNLGFIQKNLMKKLNFVQLGFETVGFGKMDFKIFKPKEGKALIHLSQHPVIEAAKIKFGKKSHTCALYRGIFSVHGEKDLNIKNCKIEETQCFCKGSDICEWSTGVFSEEKINQLKKENK